MSDLTEWREELAGVIGRARDGSDHSPMCSDEEPCRYCTPIADALLASPAMARLLAEVRAEALREAADDMDDTDDPDAIYVSNGDIDLWLRARADRIARTTAHPTDDHAGEAK